MNISLSDKEVEFLKQFAAKHYEGSKDNLGTCTPIHVVERRDRNLVEDGSDEVWIDIDDEYKVYEDFEDLIAKRRTCGQDLPTYEEIEYEDVNGIWIDSEKAYCEAYGINAFGGRYIDTYYPVAFFFVRDEAKRYMEGYQSHNCGDCRIYTYGLGYDNQGDLPVFRELLMRIGMQLNSDEGV